MHNSSRLLIAAVVGVCALLTWQLFSLSQQNQILQTKVMALEDQVSVMAASHYEMSRNLAELEKSSLQGMVDEANSALLNGWDSLLDSVKNEIERTREKLEKKGQTPIEPKPMESSKPEIERT